MSDIQTKENIYAAITFAVEKQQSSTADAERQLQQIKEEYVRSVVQAALQNEKLRRKKDSQIKIFTYVIVLILAVVFFISFSFIHILVGALAVVLYFAIVFGSTRGSNEKEARYRKRLAFFDKYVKYVPTNEELKWKTTAVATENAPASGGWSCPNCSAQNANSSDFCSSCGTQKP